MFEITTLYKPKVNPKWTSLSLIKEKWVWKVKFSWKNWPEEIIIYYTDQKYFSLYKKREILSSNKTEFIQELNLDLSWSEKEKNSIESIESIDFWTWDNLFLPEDKEIENDLDEDDFLDEDEDDISLSDEIQDLVYEEQIKELTLNPNKFNQLQSLSPREHQLESITTSVQSLVERHEKYWKGKWMLVLPTGFWKTFISAKVANDLKELNKNQSKPFRVLFLVHKNDIVQQTASFYKWDTKGPFTNYFWIDKVWILVGWKKKYHKAVNNIFTDTPNDVIVANISTLNWMLHQFPKDYFDLIIADECHRSIWRFYRECINYFDYKYLLWVTATPSRVWKKLRLSTDSLFKFFENNVIYKKDLLDSIQNKTLATPLYFVRVKDNSLEELEDDIRKQILYKNAYKWTWKNKKTYLDNFDIFYKDLSYLYQSWKKTVVFCENIDIAQKVYEKIQERNYPVIRMFHRPDRFDKKTWRQISHKVGTKITPDRFSQLIDDFKQKKWNQWEFLVVVDLFIEGTDIPEIDAMMLLRPTTSDRIYFQILWRWLRKTDEKDSCLVFDYNFDTVKLDLLKKKITLFNTIRQDLKVPEFNNLYQTASNYIDTLDNIISDFEVNDEEQERYKAKYKSTLFRDLVLPNSIDEIYNIITSIQSTNLKFYDLENYIYNVKTVWKKAIFESWHNNKEYFTELLNCSSKDELLDFLVNSETTVNNQIVPLITNSSKNYNLSIEQEKKLKEFLDKNKNIWVNYSFEEREIWWLHFIYVKYKVKDTTNYFPLWKI